MMSQTAIRAEDTSSWWPYSWFSCYSANLKGRVASWLGVTDRGGGGGRKDYGCQRERWSGIEMSRYMGEKTRKWGAICI